MSGERAQDGSKRRDEQPRHASAATVRARGLIALGLVAIVGAAVWVIPGGSPPAPVRGRMQNVALIGIERPFPENGRFLGDPYIGSKVCADCHPGESALHSRSGHARTLWPAGQRLLARRLDGRTLPDPELAGVSWSYRFVDGRLSVTRQEGESVEECIVEYAFGSGHHATTFVNLIDPMTPSILEHRLTHFTREDVLDLTPGHEVKPAPPGMTPHGGVPPPRDARLCFGCHATQLAIARDDRIDERMMIPNVSCERCHGPGRAHVLAARRGAPASELALPMGAGRMTPDELLRACGECHRHPAGPRPMQVNPDDPNLVRFQPIGLMQSACYQKGGGSLNCLTCHDAHARASSDRPGYDRICLGCHAGAAAPGAQALPTRSIARGTVCPLSPREKCVDCHMPRVPVDSARHVYLSDHWIRVHRDR